MPKKKSTESDSIGTGEFRASKELGTAVIERVLGPPKSVTYSNVNGVAILEGDIAIGTVDALESVLSTARASVVGGAGVALGIGIVGGQYRWPDCVMPYVIDASLSNQGRVTDALAHWEAHTDFRFPLRTSSNSATYPNYVRFFDDGGCYSYVGMRGGMQPISLGSGCSTGNAIHEVGHAVGLWHEQSREDRDNFVRINWENIQSGKKSQFNQHINDGADLGAYDYGSIMHYPRAAFSKNGKDTITPLDPNATIGQRTGLSQGDIDAVRTMYPGCGGPAPDGATWLEPVLHMMMSG